MIEVHTYQLDSSFYYGGASMTVVGLIVILGVIMSYLAMIFVLRRFTYKTWVFDLAVGAGMVLGAASLLQKGGSWLSWSTITLGIIWFLVSRAELRIVGSKELHLHAGDKVPVMTFSKTDGTLITEQDLIANATALLALDRGWWCPSSKVQLDEIMGNYTPLHQKGVRIYAASVDEPADAAPIQEHVGNNIMILCNLSDELLKKSEFWTREERPGTISSSLVHPNNPSQCLQRLSSTKMEESFSHAAPRE